MPDFSAFIPETHRDVSSGYVETLIQARREELFTGLMCLRIPAGETLVFAFLEGVQQKLYRCSENIVNEVPRRLWFDAFSHPSISVGSLSLPVEAMRFTRVAYEAPVVRVEESTLGPDVLSVSARKWSGGPEPSIIHIQNEIINKYWLITGHLSPIVEELSFEAGGARFSITDASFSSALPEADYQITRYVVNSEEKSWQQYELRLAFTALFRMLLHRFSDLAGRALTGRLCERLSTWAAKSGWDVAVTSNGIVNRQYFETLESEVGFYVDLFRCFQAEASPALGFRLVGTISHDVLIKFDPHRRELLNRYIYSQSGIGDVVGVLSTRGEAL